MLKLKKIAITGGIASGKSSVCSFFRELGAYVVSADAIVHEIIHTDPFIHQQMVEQFGSEVCDEKGISREAIAKKVFNDSEQLKRLEAILHPLVLRKIEESYERACKNGKSDLFVVEIPLLYEIRADQFYDEVVVVVSDEAIAKKRFQHSGFTEAEYDLRMKRQLSPKEKAQRANYIIYNNGSIQDLKNEVIRLNRIIHKQ